MAEIKCQEAITENPSVKFVSDQTSVFLWLQDKPLLCLLLGHRTLSLCGNDVNLVHRLIFAHKLCKRTQGLPSLPSISPSLFPSLPFSFYIAYNPGWPHTYNPPVSVPIVPYHHSWLLHPRSFISLWTILHCDLMVELIFLTYDSNLVNIS